MAAVDAVTAAEGARPPHRRTPGATAAAWALALAAIIALLVAGARVAALTDPGRAWIVRLVDGTKVGPAGRLHVEGLSGDVFHAFRLERLTIVDARGVWLEARGVTADWRPAELLFRRVHARRLRADALTLARRPALEARPPRPPEPWPVSVRLDDAAMRVRSLRAFSDRPGLWDVAGAMDVRRDSRATLDLHARSLMHAGDGLDVRLRMGRGQRLLVRADGIEAGGGAFAGALGMDAEKRLVIHAVADGGMRAGAVTARVVSGPDTPLDLTARWDPRGGALDGRVSLVASRFTTFFAKRLGPAATVTLRLAPIRGDLHRLTGALTAPGGVAHLDGPVNARTYSAEGLGVALDIPNLALWMPVPKLGAVHAQGQAAGNAGRLVYKGSVVGRGLDQNGLELPVVRGPAAFTLDRGELRFAADLSSAGGSGRAAFAALMGPSPRAVVDLSRLRDGKLLFRRLDIASPGLKVQARGGQALMNGALTFSGVADLPDLTPLHLGAHGSGHVAWSADEAKAAHAWTVGFRADGQRFALGIGEVDRLMGATPRLTGTALFGPDGLIRIDKLDLAGAAMTASARGVVQPRSLALSVDWTAKGPFQAGPLEIAGAAKGHGEVTGAPATPRLDLQADLASLDAGPLLVTPAHVTLSLLKGAADMDGLVAVEGRTKEGPAFARAAFRFVSGGVEVRDMAAEAGGLTAGGEIALRTAEGRGAAPSSADLHFSLAPGAFITHGKLSGALKIVGAPGVATVTAALDGGNVTAPGVPALRDLKLRAAGPLGRLPFTVMADGEDPFVWRLSAQGAAAQGATGLDMTLEGAGRVRTADVRTLRPVKLHLGNDARTIDAALAAAGGRVTVRARQAQGALDARAAAENVGLGAVIEDFAGQLNGDLTLAGRGGALRGKLDAALSSARSRDAPPSQALAVALHATLGDSRLHVSADAGDARGLASTLQLDLPAEAAADPFRIAIARTKPMAGSFAAHGEVRPLWDLVSGGQRTLSGQIEADGRFAGTLKDPIVNGRAVLARGAFLESASGLALRNVSVKADFDTTAVTVSRFAGQDARGGTMSGQGRVGLSQDSASTFAITLKRFQLLDNDIGRATASGAVTVTRAASGIAALTGRLSIDRADIVAATPVPTGVTPMDVTEVNLPFGRGGPAAAARTSPVSLDVALTAPRGIFVRGKGLDAELSLNAHVGGSTGRPTLSGEARLVRGSYDFAGKRFDFDTRGRVALGSTPEEIRLDLRATREDPTLTAVVLVRGTAARPEITLSSTPVLPQDEVLARVLFGVSASQLTPGQGAELAVALVGLTGGGGFDVMGNLRQFTGLDRLALGGSQTTGTTVSGGKYINDNVYVELTGGGRQGSGAQVELRLRKNLSLVSSVALGDTRLSIRFRRDY